MRRREFISLLGGAVAGWPLAAQAQQSAMPVVGFLDSRSPDAVSERLRAFRQGLKEIGFVEGDNLTIAYRWAEDQNDRLPELAADLVRRRVAVIVTGGPAGAISAKAATAAIPVVFLVGQDPVKLGLVTSLARPGGNLTGINFFSQELTNKRLELLRDLMPGATRIAVLVNPIDAGTQLTMRDIEPAARSIGLQVQLFNASTSREINLAFEHMGQQRPNALFVGTDPFLNGRRVQLVQLAAFYHLPATYAVRDYVEAGGLMSYGANIGDAFRQAGIYAGRILKGAKPVELPVVQSTKFELVINAETARMLGLTVAPSLFSVADEVIE